MSDSAGIGWLPAVLGACLSSLLLMGCTPVDTQNTGEPEAQPAVTVYYGTNRNRREGQAPRRMFGEQRGNFEVGLARVTGTGDAEKTRLAAVDRIPPEQFHGRLAAAVAAAPEPSILVFVHGFLRSFDQVGRLVAEFAVDTGYQGVPVMWSWPSTSNPARYTVDETNVMWAQADFARFLRGIIEESGAETVHLVAHSLGGRALSAVVLRRLLPAGVNLAPVGEFVLLAPDIDRDIFVRDIGPPLVAAGLDVTLYTSANDKAMAAALAVHGHYRAGDSTGGPVVLPGIETIDVTSANRSILGHSYFEESDAVARDLAALLNDRLTAAQRDELVPVGDGASRYWRLSLTP